MKEAKLAFENNYLKITNFIYHNSDIYYNTSFNLEIKSDCFFGIAPCEYDIKEFKIFVNDLIDMYEFKKQEVLFNDICYGSSVKFTADKTGHINIEGKIFGEALAHTLNFTFDIDQTALKAFIYDLEKLIQKI